MHTSNENSPVVPNPQHPLWNTLAEYRGIKLDEKFILKLTKANKIVSKVVKESCKILYFTSEWNFDEVLAEITELNPQEYLNLFMFIIELTNLGFKSKNQGEHLNTLANLEKKLLNFGHDRQLFLQVSSQEEQSSYFSFKIENAIQFNAINQHQEYFEYANNFPTFLYCFFNNEFEKFEYDMLYLLPEMQNRSVVLRFLRTLNLEREDLFGSLILKLAKKCTTAELLACLGASFENNGRILSSKAQKFLSQVFDGIDDEDTSVLIIAIENRNVEIMEYLITYCTHLIQQLPFKHQVKIAAAALNTNQFDILCDLIEIADYPFPENFQINSFNHARLSTLIDKRIEVKSAIEKENFHQIDEFINNNINLKFIYNIDNKSALTQAILSKKFAVFYYLKSLGFLGENCDEILKNLNEEDRSNAEKQATEQRQLNVKNSLENVDKAVILLSLRSVIHNRKTSKAFEAKYREKLTKWLKDIYKIAPEMIAVASSCDKLKIIFDFESESVENASLADPNSLGTMYPSYKWIFIGAKLSDIKREQQIKGILAHELCHYVMRLVYENDENPYYKHLIRDKEIFEEVVKVIDQWSSGLLDLNDECNGIISSVFKLYECQDFHPELIVRVVQILAEFDDDIEKTRHLQSKYIILFGFWETFIVPELRKFKLKDREEVRKINGFFGILNGLKRSKIELSFLMDLKNLCNNKFTIVEVNIPKLFLINTYSYLQEKYGDQLDTQNIFVDFYMLANPETYKQIQKFSDDYNNLNIFIDCCTEDLYLKKIDINKNSNLIFVVSNESQSEIIVQNLENSRSRVNPERVKINYKWSDLTENCQKLLLETKINFQNNSQILLKDLLEVDGVDEIINSQLLNFLVEKIKISINNKTGQNLNDEFCELLFKPRKFEKKNKENETISKGSFKIHQNNILIDNKNEKYILISDRAGKGKSWAMKNFSKLLREQNPTKWVTYVDLKQFIEEFRQQENELEFSSFIIEKILKPKQKFEASIFKRFYNDGKVFILFDGFDEIAPNCAEFVTKLAKSFYYNGGNQLWIATRDYFEIDLKEHLQFEKSVYSLEEMSEDDGIDLIAASWILIDLKKNNNQINFKSKAEFEEFLETSLKFGEYKEKARKIVEKVFLSKSCSVGLPQLFKMISDGFKDENDVTDLKGSKIYTKFVKKLYKRWSDEKGQIRKVASIECQEYELNFWKFHQYHAIASLFPELAAMLFPGYDGREWSEAEIIACGLMSLRDGKFYFIHETFREFFVADFVAKALKMSQVNENVVKLFVDILTVEKFGIIRMFLNDTIEDHSNLGRIKFQINEIFDKFNEMKNFNEYFDGTFENLADVFIIILKNGNYTKVLALLHLNIKKTLTCAKDSKVFLKLQEFLFCFLKDDDLKNLLIKQEIFLELIKSDLKIEVFEDFLVKIDAKTNRKFIQRGLTTVSNNEGKENIFHFLCQSSSLDVHKIKTFLKIMQKYLTTNEIFELIRNCNSTGENVLQVCVQREYKENLQVLWAEIENYFASKNASQQFKRILNPQDNKKENILTNACMCENIEIQRILWDLLVKTFRNDELMKFILQRNKLGRKTNLFSIALDYWYYSGENFVHALVRKNKNPTVIEFTLMNFKQIFNDTQYKEILKSPSGYETCLLRSAVCCSKSVEVHRILWRLFREIFNSDREIYNMLTKIKPNEISFFEAAMLYTTGEVFEFIFGELEGIGSTEEIRTLLSSLGCLNRNLLQFAAWSNENLSLHDTLWKIFKIYFEPSEILNFIKHVDKNGDNILFNSVEGNTAELVIYTWNQVKVFMTRSEQIEYLQLKGFQGKNLLNRTFMSKYKANIFNVIKNIFDEYGIKNDQIYLGL